MICMKRPAAVNEEVLCLGKEFGILQDDQSTRILGHGSYGTVYLVRQLKSGTKWNVPKPQYRDQGSEAFLKRQYRFCSKGEIGYI